jgi:hypothetical protein
MAIENITKCIILTVYSFLWAIYIQQEKISALLQQPLTALLVE